MDQRVLESDSLYKFYNFFSLEQRGKIIAEYIWVDGSGIDVRSKQRTLPKKVTSLEELPEWNFDGSSTLQATTADSEVTIKPVAMFPDPFRRGDNILVLCDTYVWEDKTHKKLIPANTNFRYYANKVMELAKDQVPWFGIEQEYTLFNRINTGSRWPLGWPLGGFPGPQGPYYCSTGAMNCFGRAIMDSHYRACLHAGINISGTNAEVMPGQWEFQIGPSEGIEAADHLWIARYLLSRVAEDFNVSCSFDPKPVGGDWNGAGCHTNFSTSVMREEEGMKHIKEAIEKLSLRHKEHLYVYGEDNEKRLTGLHETSSMNEFSSGVGHRGASVRIPTSANSTGKGYFEDRRPASNMDPYLVTGIMVDTICLDAKHFDGCLDHYKKYMDWKKTQPVAGSFH